MAAPEELRRKVFDGIRAAGFLAGESLNGLSGEQVDGALNVQIGKVRRKIIELVPGSGFRFDGWFVPNLILLVEMLWFGEVSHLRKAKGSFRG